MRILYLTHRLPYAPNRGDRIRAYYMLREMSRFADVSLFSLVHDAEEESRGNSVPFATSVRTARVSRLRNLARGVVGLASSMPLTHALLDAPTASATLADMVGADPPDIVVAFCSGMARFALARPLNGLPLVVDFVDVDSAKWRDLAPQARPPWSWVYRREARMLGAFEREAAARAQRALVVNEREHDLLRRLAPAAHVTIVPNGIDAEAFAPPVDPIETRLVIFCGVMNYAPNDEAARWFATAVWPSIRRAMPGAQFVVVGSSPTSALRTIANRDPSIEVTGSVAKVQPFLWKSAVSVAPLFFARGVQNKVLEALAAGLPVVAAPAVLGGLPADALSGCVPASTPEDFAARTIELLRLSPHERRGRARMASLEHLSWTSRLASLEDVLRASLTPRAAPASRLHAVSFTPGSPTSTEVT